MKLLANGFTNTKQAKSDSYSDEYLSAIMYLAPHKNAGRGNVCPAASSGCAAACLYSAGMGRFSNVQNARVRKTNLWFDNRTEFLAQLEADISAFAAKCDKAGKKPAVRLNGTSDIRWESHGIITNFPDIQFYDYTKIVPRMLSYCKGQLPHNYHLTFSRSENNEADCLEVLRAGGNVSAVFRYSLPDKYRRFRVFNGDEHDLRFLDPTPRWVGLTAKGDGKRDLTGFVIQGN